ncbi:Predicted membrane protein [Cognatishimia maritima]|uniref:Predicted membrane protein n=1 Tax=Cognatishimia maritima TaxID=870908 RepID=A0A1M5RJB6_9RHOB|nr:Predicted membrane protein [Cognatishimia maritima]
MPLLLILLGILPIAASLYRLGDLAITDPSTIADPDVLRFFAAPSSIAMHVAFGSLFLILGAFQVSAGFRRAHRTLHKRMGYLAALSAVVFSLSGVWIVFTYAPHSLANPWIDVGRVFFGTAITAFILLGIWAAISKDLKAHRAWMIRGYALAASSGIQSYLIAIVTVINGAFDPEIADSMIWLGWVIGILAAERIIVGKRGDGLRPTTSSYRQ